MGESTMVVMFYDNILSYKRENKSITIPFEKILKIEFICNRKKDLYKVEIVFSSSDQQTIVFSQEEEAGDFYINIIQRLERYYQRKDTETKQ